MVLALIPAAMTTAFAAGATEVTGVNVVDGTEGQGPFPIPLAESQVLLANIQTTLRSACGNL